MKYRTKLEEVLKKSGRTQVWLAKQVGVSRTQMNFWTLGKNEPRDANKRKLAEALDESIGYLFYSDLIEEEKD